MTTLAKSVKINLFRTLEIKILNNLNSAHSRKTAKPGAGGSHL
jgi:hypothetical protein